MRMAVALASIALTVATARAQTPPDPASGERAVLYEENPADAAGSSFPGTVTWRVEPLKDRPSETSVRADVTVPTRGISLSLRMQRNTDASLPASHTVELEFFLDPQFPSGGIANMPGILMKANEQARGSPFAGLAVKVKPQYFLFGLSSTPPDLARNLELLRTREWFDIPMVYDNGRRAIIAMAKGRTGTDVFAKLIADWPSR